MSKAQHFYLVFNPMINQGGNYKTQAHEFYCELKRKSQSLDGSHPFLYWGKLKVNSDSDEDIKKYEEVIARNNESGQDTHIYISDYHNFWVAKVESVHKKIHNPENTLAFYDNKEVDIWFKISDMDLVSAEFEETLYYLSRLSIENEYHTEKIPSVHPYLGGLKFPMIVEDNLNEKYFKNIFTEDRLRLTRENPLIQNNMVASHLNERMKSFVLPPQVFSKLSHLVKKELLSVEMSLTQKSGGENSESAHVLDSYLRILESVMHESLGKVATELYGDCLYVKQNGEAFSHHKSEGDIRLADFNGNISIEAFVDLLSETRSFGNLSLDKLFENYPKMIAYFKEELAPFIIDEEIVGLRKAFKYNEQVSVSTERVFFLRNKILGVGCKGIINNLFQLLYDSERDQYLQKAS